MPFRRAWVAAIPLLLTLSLMSCQSPRPTEHINVRWWVVRGGQLEQLNDGTRTKPWSEADGFWALSQSDATDLMGGIGMCTEMLKSCTTEFSTKEAK